MNISDLIIKKIVSIYPVNLKPNTYRNSNRPYSAFCFKLDGKSVYTQNNIEHRSDCRKVIVVPKGSTYTYTVQEQGVCVIIDFLGDGLPEEITTLEVNDADTIKGIISNMEYAWTFKKPGYREICLSQFYHLLYYMVLHENNPYVPKVHKTKIDSSLHYLHEHICDHALKINELAEQSEISEIYFRKLFIEIFGVSPKKYITMLRMNRAKEFLNANELTISQTAEAVGFNDVYSFCKVFRAETGSTPTEYRKARKRERETQ